MNGVCVCEFIVERSFVVLPMTQERAATVSLINFYRILSLVNNNFYKILSIVNNNKLVIVYDAQDFISMHADPKYLYLRSACIEIITINESKYDSNSIYGAWCVRQRFSIDSMITECSLHEDILC